MQLRIKNYELKIEKYILLALAVVLLAGCGAKKKAVQPMVQVPTWHTCVIQGAQATVNKDGQSLSASVTFQTVRDSMLVISVMPLLGMEMLRVEATPLEVVAIDKFNRQYAQATFADINRKLTPTLNWDELQRICTAELPTGNEKARLVYQFGDEPIELIINYAPRRLDVPVRVSHQPLSRYQQIDITKWL